MSETNFNVNMPSSESDDDMSIVRVLQKKNWLPLRIRLCLKQQEEAQSMA